MDEKIKNKLFELHEKLTETQNSLVAIARDIKETLEELDTFMDDEGIE